MSSKLQKIVKIESITFFWFSSLFWPQITTHRLLERFAQLWATSRRSWITLNHSELPGVTSHNCWLWVWENESWEFESWWRYWSSSLFFDELHFSRNGTSVNCWWLHFDGELKLTCKHLTGILLAAWIAYWRYLSGYLGGIQRAIR